MLGTLERGEVDGLFSGFIAGDVPTHRFRFTHGDVTWEEDDAYRFGTLLSDSTPIFWPRDGTTSFTRSSAPIRERWTA